MEEGPGYGIFDDELPPRHKAAVFVLCSLAAWAFWKSFQLIHPII